jgi:hypothetical protein
MASKTKTTSKGRKPKINSTKAKASSPSWRSIELFVANPTFKPADLLKALEAEGLSLAKATASTIQSIARRTIMAMQGAGLTKRNLL